MELAAITLATSLSWVGDDESILDPEPPDLDSSGHASPPSHRREVDGPS
jgi:hypothetical protein